MVSVLSVRSFPTVVASGTNEDGFSLWPLALASTVHGGDFTMPPLSELQLVTNSSISKLYCCYLGSSVCDGYKASPLFRVATCYLSVHVCMYLPLTHTLTHASPYCAKEHVLNVLTPDFESSPTPSNMTAWGDFLVECAKFPFPEMVENGSVNTTRISPIVLGLLDPPWRARYAVRDEDLVPKLCQTLEDIVKDEHIVDVDEEQLVRFFGNHLQSWTLNSGREIVNSRWSTRNRNEYHVRRLDFLSWLRIYGCSLADRVRFC